jgi:hypothetical protein
MNWRDILPRLYRQGGCTIPGIHHPKACPDLLWHLRQRQDDALGRLGHHGVQLGVQGEVSDYELAHRPTGESQFGRVPGACPADHRRMGVVRRQQGSCTAPVPDLSNGETVSYGISSRPIYAPGLMGLPKGTGTVSDGSKAFPRSDQGW